jgi:putative ABC transport system permease protein
MPDWKPELRARLAHLHLPGAHEAAIIDELSQHLDDRRAELVAHGIEPDRATRMTFDELQDARLLAPRLGALQASHGPAPLPLGAAGRSLFSGLGQDLRYACRTLLREPLFTAVAIVTLALGIGLNTAMFSFMNTLLLRPLPFPDASRLVTLSRTTPQQNDGGFSPADYLALRDAESAFGRFAAYQPSSLSVAEPGLSTAWYLASPNFFDVLELPPALGRSFRPEDAIAGNDRVVLLSHAFWLDHFGGAANVIGQTIRTQREAYEIIGVLPPAAGDHRLLGRAGLFSPLVFSPAARLSRTSQAIRILGRRAQTVSEAQAATFVTSFGARMAADFPVENARTAWRSQPLPRTSTGSTGRAIVGMLLGLSGFVLLIACSNLANLLLARTIERSRELAVRAALGASRLQLMRTLAFEAALLAGAGGLGALAVATWTTNWLRSTVIAGGGPAFEFPLDWRVLSFTVGASVATLLLCGLAPALFAGRMRANDTLKTGGRGSTTSRRQTRLRHALIATQFALALILLAGAGFFLRGANNLLKEHFGWSAERVVQADVTLPEKRYADGRAISAFHTLLLERVARLPGIESASVSYGLPYLGLQGQGLYLAEGAASSQGQQTLLAKLNGVSPAYFEVTGTRLLAGRAFSEADTAVSPQVAILSQSMAQALFPGGRAIGGRVGAPSEDKATAWMEVVGVVADVRSIDVAQQASAFQLYQPTTQDPHSRFTLAVRATAEAPGAIAPALAATLADLDAELSVQRLMSATARMQEITSSLSLIQQLLTVFAGLGLFLAALGIYGAMSRMVAQRTDEIGLRMALGAEAMAVTRLVLGAGARIVLLGAAVGLAGAAGLSRLLAAVFPTLRTDSWLVGAAATIMLVTMALVACYRPTRRAIGIDPMTALRSE